jgi:hypothetical protein
LNSVIDEIVREHWQNFPHKATDQTEKARRSPTPQSLSSQKADILNREKYLRARLANRPKQQNFHMVEPRQPPAGNQTTAQPIRFLTNTTLIGPADARACLRVGQQVPMFSFVQNREILYTCTAADVLSPELAAIFTSNILPAVTTLYSRLLSLPRVAVLQLDQAIFAAFGGECDSDVPIPPALLSPGVPGADIVVFATARPYDVAGIQVIGFACNFAQISESPEQFGRPLAASINFNPSAFQNLLADATEFDFRQAIRLAIQQMGKALGFDSLFFESYVDSQTGRPYSPSPIRRTTRTGTSPSGETFSRPVVGLATPTLLAFARAHFACSAVPAVEIESEDGVGFGYWEARVAGNEILTRLDDPIKPISGLTLGMFADMGWYSVNLPLAEHLAWGRGLGCGFITGRCEETWPPFPGYFCTQQRIGCSPDRLAKGVCNPVQYPTPLDPYFQHFTTPTLGGSQADTDFCPFTESLSFCGDTSQTPASNLGETFGPASNCFEVGEGGSIDAENPTLACFPSRCTNTTLQVNVLGTFFTCAAGGGPVDISSVVPTGVVNCPPASVVCGNIQPQVTPAPPTPTLPPGPPAPQPTSQINERDVLENDQSGAGARGLGLGIVITAFITAVLL